MPLLIIQYQLCYVFMFMLQVKFRLFLAMKLNVCMCYVQFEVIFCDVTTSIHYCSQLKPFEYFYLKVRIFVWPG